MEGNCPIYPLLLEGVSNKRIMRMLYDESLNKMSYLPLICFAFRPFEKFIHIDKMTTPNFMLHNPDLSRTIPFRPISTIKTIERSEKEYKILIVKLLYHSIVLFW